MRPPRVVRAQRLIHPRVSACATPGPLVAGILKGKTMSHAPVLSLLPAVFLKIVRRDGRTEPGPHKAPAAGTA